jgi:cytochrome c6
MARPAALVLALAALVLAASGCGGSEDTTPTPETVIGTVAADEGESQGGGGGGGGGGGAAEGDATAGKEVYASAGCGSCHTFSDAGSTGTVGPNLDDSSIDFEGAVTQIENGGGGMPPFSSQLSEEEIANVAAYVVTARSR